MNERHVTASLSWRRRVARRDGSEQNDVVSRIFELEREMLDGPELERPELRPEPPRRHGDAVQNARTPNGRKHRFFSWMRGASAKDDAVASAAKGTDPARDTARYDHAPNGRECSFYSWVCKALIANGTVAFAMKADPVRVHRAIEEYKDLARALEKEAQGSGDAREPLSVQNREAFKALVTLAWVNLAEHMDATGGDEREVEEAFGAACRLRTRIASGHAFVSQFWWHARHGRWEDAKKALAMSVSVEADAKNLETEQELSLWLSHAKAHDLLRKGAFHAAEAELRSALHGVTVATPTLQDWRCQLHLMLADCLIGQGLPLDAVSELASAAGRCRGADDRRNAGRLQEKRADTLVHLGHDAEALVAYEASLGFVDAPSPDPAPETTGPSDERRDTRARLLAWIGLLRLHLGGAENGHVSPSRSQEPVSDREWPNPDEPTIQHELVRLPGGRYDLQATLKAHVTGLLGREPSAARRRDLVFVLRDLLDRSAHLAGEGDGADVQEGVVPIRVRVPDWVVAEERDPNQAVKDVMEPLRERLRDDFGVDVPGVRVGIGKLERQFTLLIDEVERARIDLPGDGAVVGDPGALGAAGLKPIARVPGARRVAGGTAEPDRSPAYYVAADDLARARASGRETWTPLRCVAACLEAELPAWLPEFIGHQGVWQLQGDPEAGGDTGPVSADRRHRLIASETWTHMAPLTRLVHALVAERVPVGDFAEVHRLFLEGQRRGDTVETTAARFRLMKRECLWGNDPGRRAVLLPRGWIAFLGEAGPADGVIAVPEAALADLRERVAAGLRANGTWTTLVVEDRARRPLVKAAIESDHPDVPVLALAEVVPEVLATMRSIGGEAGTG